MSIIITMPEVSKSIVVKGFRKIADLTVAGKSGIYVFKDSEGSALYVGKSKDLLRRINEHLKSAPFIFNGRAYAVDIYVEDNPANVDIYEIFMINALNPEFNRAGLYTEEFQRQNAEELFELEILLSEAEDEERSLVSFIDHEEYEIMLDEVAETGELIVAIRELRKVRKRIAELKREIAVKRRRTYKTAA